MIFNTSSICYYTVLTFVINFVLTNSEEALLFDLEENSLVEKEKSIFEGITKTVCHKCAAACPAIISEKSSVGKRALVVQQLYDRSEKMDKIKLPECDESIETSFLINEKSGLLEIGYEIHDLKNIIEPSQLKSKQDEFLSLYPSNAFSVTDPRKILFDYFKSGKKPTPPEKSDRSFIWIPVLFIDLDIDTMSPKRIEYNPDSGIHRPRGDCNVFDVGEEFGGKYSHFIPYSPANQWLIFRGKRDLPDPLPKGESQCGQKYGCLVEHQIIPSYFMHTYIGALATCTPMNTVPIWDSITEQIHIVDRYLYAMIQIWKSNVHFTNGFFEILKPRKTHFKKIPVSRQELYLDQTYKKIPVPMIFYKMVEYKINIPAPQERTDYYSALVVIHNDPTSDASKQRLCKENNTIRGWEDIRNTESKSGLTYVCTVNKDLAEKLSLYKGDVVKEGSPLRLDKFPVYDFQKREYLYENKKPEISEKLKELV